MTPLERAARLLCMRLGGDPDRREPPVTPDTPFEWEKHVPTVRAVLQAIRTPSEGMLEAAAETPGMKAASDAMVMHQARGYGFAEGSFDAGSPLHQAWTAMIDQLLEEG